MPVSKVWLSLSQYLQNSGFLNNFFVKNFFTKFHEKLGNCLVANTRSQIDR